MFGCDILRRKTAFERWKRSSGAGDGVFRETNAAPLSCLFSQAYGNEVRGQQAAFEREGGVFGAGNALTTQCSSRVADGV